MIPSSLPTQKPLMSGNFLTVESQHPYTANMNVYTTISMANVSCYLITFDSATVTEYSWDYVTLYKDDTHSSYWGAQKLSGGQGQRGSTWPGLNYNPPVVIRAQSFVLNFKSDSSQQYFGYVMYVSESASCTDPPTAFPTSRAPTRLPTVKPTRRPSPGPSLALPSLAPTLVPTLTHEPSSGGSYKPSQSRAIFRVQINNSDDYEGNADFCYLNSTNCNLRSAISYCLLLVPLSSQCEVVFPVAANLRFSSRYGEIALSNSYYRNISFFGNNSTITSDNGCR